MIVEVFLAVDEPLAVDRGQEETAAFVVPEELHREQGEPPRLLQPAQLARRDVQLVETVCDVGVVVEHPAAPRLPTPPRHVRWSLPSAESGPSTNSPHVRAASTRSLRSRRRPASASAAMASPFHEATTLSSRSGFGRCSRSAKSLARVSSSSSPRRTKRPCSNGWSSLRGTSSSSVH